MNINSILIDCPLCGYNESKTLFSSNTSVTSDSQIIEQPTDTCQCKRCGFFYNSKGARGFENNFYEEDYDLLSDSSNAEFIYQGEKGRLGINSEMAEFISKNLELDYGARILDVGCGKGLLLRELHETRADLELFGVEPSKNAFKFASNLLPHANLHEGLLSETGLPEQSFDIISTIGVLEHVPEPALFLNEIKKYLRPNGQLFVSVPNFLLNPTDIITFDHLSRFTPKTLGMTIKKSGFELQKVICGKRVPMWGIAKKSNNPDEGSYSDKTNFGSKAKKWFDDCLKVFSEMNNHVKKHDINLGIYGTGLLVPAGIAMGKLDPDNISSIFDDNQHLHGSTRFGKKVLNLKDAQANGIEELTFSANPVYLRQMFKNVRKNVSNVRVWKLPELDN